MCDLHRGIAGVVGAVGQDAPEHRDVDGPISVAQHRFAQLFARGQFLALDDLCGKIVC
ncbi:hypothetical protein ACN2XU_12495 [Primorskyibacter sp. 2E107]|uniref:hypothetical protein n=1 Tax=Primorskyibacter sp. 2E107 TaxID=3403458 RepID=UPI003AF57CD5